MDHQTHIERQTIRTQLPEHTLGSETRLFFGGSFDPPHIGHVRLPELIADELNIATTIYVPAGRSPFKSASPTSNTDRLRMLEIATRHSNQSVIWKQELNDSELNPDQPSYWADTWAIVREMDLPGMNRFLIGADQAISMHHWHRYTEFWKDAFVVLRDDTDSIDSLLTQLESLDIWTSEELAHWRSQIVIAPTIDASSTHIREELSDSTKREEPIHGLDPLVQEYILEHGLYTRTP